MNRQILRGVLVCLILAVGGVALNYAVQKEDALLLTGVLFGASLALGFVYRTLGPVQQPDERAVTRSKDAALDAIRIAGAVGMLGGAYAQILHAPDAFVALAGGMVLPTIIWWFLYMMYNWRDTH